MGASSSTSDSGTAPPRSAAAAAERGGAVPLSDVELLAPIPRPRQDVVCLGMNYRDHAEESARYSADAFTKNSTAAVYFSKRVSEAGKPDGVIPRHALSLIHI